MQNVFFVTNLQLLRTPLPDPQYTGTCLRTVDNVVLTVSNISKYTEHRAVSLRRQRARRYLAINP